MVTACKEPLAAAQVGRIRTPLYHSTEMRVTARSWPYALPVHIVGRDVLPNYYTGDSERSAA